MVESLPAVNSSHYLDHEHIQHSPISFNYIEIIKTVFDVQQPRERHLSLSHERCLALDRGTTQPRFPKALL